MNICNLKHNCQSNHYDVSYILEFTSAYRTKTSRDIRNIISEIEKSTTDYITREEERALMHCLKHTISTLYFSRPSFPLSVLRIILKTAFYKLHT